MKKPYIVVHPLHSNFDEEIEISVKGCNPSDEISILTYIHDDRDELFVSDATFIANKNGEVHIANEASIKGTYTGIDRNGIFWSAKHVKKKHDDYFLKTNINALTIKMQLKIRDELVHEVAFERSFYKNDIHVVELNQNHIIGTLYLPKEKGDYPNVLLLAGSDGGKLDPAASLLAAKGYNVLDLAYFNQDGVPKDLENIPLEYFYNALQFLKEQTNNRSKVIVIGYSKGAELALLLASEYDEFSAVIAGAPSAYITSGMRNGIFAPIPSWTINDQAKSFLKMQHKFSNMLPVLKQMILKRPVSFFNVWEDSLKKDNNRLEDARIKVENIKAPVLLISGDKDGIWPSSTFSNEIKSKLDSIEHLQFKEGGHFVSFPYALPHLPANVYEHLGGRTIMDCGGTKEANADAAIQSWNYIQNFIKKHSE
ncbi:alpha/beta fold hydrolase [Alkalihalobacillus trypoxylicola]|uniref:Acyl-CoA thioesterase n=1 Tax=Alkalihalobacillus trypoxylicola TaxID=519424 RepID=A0A162E5F8_9BACI|nr:alpha/beta fold hydrolase [Alkalihalobacillus trypoxylicola]KYG31780.1 hypothetical protein AZF04_03075 [Alkalihalobacillus trypoxylicola]